jgi:GNAT superfamily N-acetyltransferase
VLRFAKGNSVTQPIEMFRDLPRPAAFSPDAVIRELGDGLVLRQASAADCEALAEFNRIVQADPPDYQPLPMMADWTRDLMSGHPRVRPTDFLLVDDTSQKRVAATMMLISHRFSYGGTELEAGQPELVGTHPDYRRRGLIRQMFDVLHAWSAERGQRLQVIGGIPWFYRQFGYELALEHGVEWRAAAADLPEQLEPGLRVRDAVADDIPLLMRLYEQRSARHRVVCLRDAEQWRYELEVRREGSDPAWTVCLLERANRTPVAACAHRRQLRGGRLQLVMLEVVPDAAQAEAAQPLLAALRQRGEAFAARDGQSFSGLSFYLGSKHPFHDVTRGQAEREPDSYALYVRVPDLVHFLEHVAPALEARLAESAFAGGSATLDLSCYTEGVRLVLEGGRIRAVESWLPSTGAIGQVAFPERSFLQLLMGFRSLAELERFYPDCVIYDAASGALTEALFPTQQTGLWPTF